MNVLAPLLVIVAGVTLALATQSVMVAVLVGVVGYVAVSLRGQPHFKP